MFSSLESNWDQSARRGWTALASFTIQAFSLSLLLAISLLWVQRAPQVRWLQLTAPAAFTSPVETQPAHGHSATGAAGNPRTQQIVAPSSIPLRTALSNDVGPVPTAPDFSSIDAGPGRGPGADVPHGIGGGFPVVLPPRPTVVRPLVVSDLGEGSLLHRVQPVYPSIARQARVQGAVELRAIISKTGTIEDLVVVRGHPMLASAAIDAVRQWRYRPYLLNHDAIEVETEITVNFVLSGT